MNANVHLLYLFHCLPVVVSRHRCCLLLSSIICVWPALSCTSHVGGFFRYVDLPKTLFLPRYWPCCLMHHVSHLACSQGLLRCPLASFFSFHTFLYFVVLVCIRLSLFSFSAAPFSAAVDATTVSLIIIPELLPFISFSLARSISTCQTQTWWLAP